MLSINSTFSKSSHYLISICTKVERLSTFPLYYYNPFAHAHELKQLGRISKGSG